jgi:methyl-accepting chemotaxis protein
VQNSLAPIYRINDSNLVLRRSFIELRPADVAVLRKVASWGQKAAEPMAREFYDHQFSFAPTAGFFASYAQKRGCGVDELRRALESAQAGYFKQIFEEARGAGRYGVNYFEQRLKVGQLHNTINLPLKWYLGSYQKYFDLARKHLRRSYPHRPLLRARVERALLAVFNLDMQAILDAFYFDTFAAMGVDLAGIEILSQDLDLSDHNAQLKGAVSETLKGVARATETVRAASEHIATTSEQAGRATDEIAQAVASVAQGAERQVRMVSEARESAEETASAASEAREAADEGMGAAEQASRAMRQIGESAVGVTQTMRELAARSEEVGGIVETINGIAEQTNLLALNAAIEAARAGEQGRGFAVVAEEVRKLAEESQGAAARIADLIREIQAETNRAVEAVEDSARQTEEGTAVVEQAREAFQAISQKVRDIAVRIDSIAGATAEVASVAEEFSASTQQVSASTQETAASTQEVSSSAQDLARTAEELERLFKVNA